MSSKLISLHVIKICHQKFLRLFVLTLYTNTFSFFSLILASLDLLSRDVFHILK